mmetsp:Transcript_48772/g.112832  ORF Transcript_48772/g.112832 Transcript_48772/m.112832 type:complete len:128 (-) Transcript_48772:242-625(-)
MIAFVLDSYQAVVADTSRLAWSRSGFEMHGERVRFRAEEIAGAQAGVEGIFEVTLDGTYRRAFYHRCHRDAWSGVLDLFEQSRQQPSAERATNSSHDKWRNLLRGIFDKVLHLPSNLMDGDAQRVPN